MWGVLSIIFYVALGVGALMIATTCLVYVLSRAITWGAVGFAGIGAVLITIGVIANLNIAWDKEGGKIQLETNQALTQGVAGTTDAIKVLQDAQALSTEQFQKQIETIVKWQEAFEVKFETLAEKQGMPEPRPIEVFDPSCSPAAISDLNMRESELNGRKQELQREIAEALTRQKNAKWGNTYGAEQWVGATHANIDALKTQLDGINLSIAQLESKRTHCAIAAFKGTKKP